MASKNSKPESMKTSKKISMNSSKSNENGQEVLLNLPAGMKYRMPGKNQRIIVGGIVIGLNVLLVISVILYFYLPGFQEFVYNFGR